MEVIQIVGVYNGDIVVTNFSFISFSDLKKGQCHPSLNVTLSFNTWFNSINMEVVQVVGVRISG